MPSQSTTPPGDDNERERREFYRIHDRIGLEVRRLDDTHTSEDPFNNSPLEALKTEFRRLDQDVRTHLASLAERDRLLAGLVKSLNSKVDALARIIAFEQNPLQPEDWQEVTLSEGGLSFYWPTATFETGDHLAIRMTLPPELYQPRATAHVVDTERDNQGRTRVHTLFAHLDDNDRQQIARHVMRWQIRQRQKG
ncbi:PilZ domain-containing protein [Marinobacter daepoensis]|uniref:PilZ domain-containing protein n=1 Tax=Marinobacter daepoensis TaxID=262077 RepID=A0ABS3BCT3_9GAMM|nr:PilZ domain-containing protein [Marinobacter daepoensis]MBN7769406.1 PilZ domain-containing protein [Marinobacter daepoensis]MBY6031933.1 PilZ domain-containing protein [Marinobacter daepoensis]MBY6078096.1 PilZ domain-containing protein [Marinobacter daepoensis]